MEENGIRYSISDVCRLVGVEAHVLRYWEKELELAIPRNEMGHRYYLEEHVDMFKKIHEMKDLGYQLKAIRNEQNISGVDRPVHKRRDDINADTFERMRQSIAEAVLAAVRAGNRELCEALRLQTDRQLDERIRMQEEQEELHFRKLDTLIRNCQQERKESAGHGMHFLFRAHR